MSQLHRSTKLGLALFFLILFTSAYLAIWNRLPVPPRAEIAAAGYMGTLLLHLVLGIGAVLAVIRFAGAWIRAIATTPGIGRWLGVLSVVALLVSLAAGILVVAYAALVEGSTSPMDPARAAHSLGALVSLLSGAAWLWMRWLAKTTD